MPKVLLTISLLLFWGCTNHTELSIHSQVKNVHSISSSEGQDLFQTIDQELYLKTKKYWQAQRKNYCGVCSLTIAGNTLNQNNHIDQDNFFDNMVAEEVILPATVAKMGMTLRELHEATVRRLVNIKVAKHYAHISGLDLFRLQLKNLNTDTQLIVNFSRQSLKGEGMRSGHFSLATAYDAKSRKVLILEVQSSRESFWVQDKDLYNAMLAVDPVSKIPRGWLLLNKEK
ncbi:phytochelatin synthase family protein [Lentisphaera profundi]|uniref:glutathione gamma-glutamylcysteinyltransferase n=1 Tax=Lentisphaera profundi TaxID=1658616 RepID=A0ABY7VSQ1_9BACT|nr:phytochelatin synthase family protein [Lentisphaera profundi]WDE95922.1 phytochelatin synthase family protein [Lentisphaera profundi]